MGFSSAIYKEAFEIKKRQQHNATLRYEKLRDELYTANPELLELESRLRTLGSTAAITAMSGDMEKVKVLQAEASVLKDKKDAMLEKIELPQLRYDCPICKDTGYCDDGKICECVTAIAKQIAYKNLSEEMPLEASTFQNFDLKFYGDKAEGNTSPKKRMTQILKICREFALNFGKDGGNLLFLGGAGLGKTHLSLAIANEVLAQNYSVVYGSIQNLINKISNETFSYKGTTDVTDGILGCDLLIIDDLGSEMSTQFSQSCIYNIINTRIMRSLPTIISTNLTLEEIERQYTARVSSRIIGNYTLLQFLGADIRQQKAISAMKKK